MQTGSNINSRIIVHSVSEFAKAQVYITQCILYKTTIDQSSNGKSCIGRRSLYEKKAFLARGKKWEKVD